VTVSPYPLVFRPKLKLKVWGGRALAHLDPDLPADALVGESWELADLAASAPGGGGGGEERSRIAGGPLEGETLADAMRLWGDQLLGEASPAPDGSFPLLVKLLDAREDLSVQVHPPAGWSGAPGEAHKSECWYVLRARPDGLIWKGLREGLDREGLRRALDGDVEDALLREAARPGQLHWLPGGTVHALGAGVQVLEVQTPSDTTFRLYDWTRKYDRAPRELHVEQALACATFGPAPAAASLPAGSRGGALLQAGDFSVEEHRLAPDQAVPCGDGARPTVVHVIAGRVSVEGLELAQGTTCLVPAAITGWTDLQVCGREARVLLIRP